MSKSNKSKCFLTVYVLNFWPMKPHNNENELKALENTRKDVLFSDFFLDFFGDDLEPRTHRKMRGHSTKIRWIKIQKFGFEEIFARRRKKQKRYYVMYDKIRRIYRLSDFRIFIFYSAPHFCFRQKQKDSEIE
jgi:hypothetical protein